MNVSSLLPREPRVALCEPSGRAIRFDELHDAGERLAEGLAARVPAGGRVLVLQPMGIDLYVLLLALFRAGITGVLVDPSAGWRRMRRSLAPLGIAGILGPWKAQALRLVMPELRGGAIYASSGWAPLTERLAELTGPPLGQRSADPDAPALLTFTTGSTGRPKAVARSLRYLDTQRKALLAHLDLGPADVDLATLPVFALASLAAGAEVVLADCDLRRPGKADPARILAQMRAHRVTTVSASPAFFAPLARHLAERGERYDGLRALWTGGARVPARLCATLCEVFPKARVEILYGSTEAEPIAGLDARANLANLEAGEKGAWGALVGRPAAGVSVRVVVPGTLEPARDVGEIVVSGPHVNPSYFEDPEADAATKLREDGRLWHRTGDTGRLDLQGRLWLVGRVPDAVCGLHPYPIEAAAERVPGVARTALVARRGAPVLCVEGLRSSLDAVRRVVSGLPGAGPIQVIHVSNVPVDRRHNAKVDRIALQRRVG